MRMAKAEVENKRGWQCGLAPAVNLPQSQMAGPWSLGCDGLALIARGNPCLWVSEAWEEEDWERLASHQPSSPVCTDGETWAFIWGQRPFLGGLFYFDSAAVSNTTLWKVVSETIISFLLIVLLLLSILRDWTEKAECINKCKCDERKHKSDCIITVSDIRFTGCFAKRGALQGHVSDRRIIKKKWQKRGGIIFPSPLTVFA